MTCVATSACKLAHASLSPRRRSSESIFRVSLPLPFHSTIEQMQRSQGYQNDMANAGAIVTFVRFGLTLDRFVAQLNASVVPAFIPPIETVATLDAPRKVAIPPSPLLLFVALVRAPDRLLV
jgi:hypothetical protein